METELRALSDEALTAALLVLCERVEQLDEAIAALRAEVVRRES